jgi:hypothetical protein
MLLLLHSMLVHRVVARVQVTVVGSMVETICLLALLWGLCRRWVGGQRRRLLLLVSLA